MLSEIVLGMGKATAAERLGSDSSFGAYALAVLAEREAAHQVKTPTRTQGKDYRQLKPGVHRQADMAAEQVEHFSSWGHIRESPLASLDAIEAAGRSGDWTELERAATEMLAANKIRLNGDGYGSGNNPAGKALPLLSDDPVIR